MLVAVIKQPPQNPLFQSPQSQIFYWRLFSNHHNVEFCTSGCQNIATMSDFFIDSWLTTATMFNESPTRSHDPHIQFGALVVAVFKASQYCYPLVLWPPLSSCRRSPSTQRRSPSPFAPSPLVKIVAADLDTSTVKSSNFLLLFFFFHFCLVSPVLQFFSDINRASAIHNCHTSAQRHLLWL